MVLNCTRKTNGVTVDVIGELDHHTAPSIKKQLDELLMDESILELILDLKSLTFMDSSGIGVIMGRYKTMQSRGGKVYIKNINKPIDKLFKLSGLYQIVNKL